MANTLEYRESIAATGARGAQPSLASEVLQDFDLGRLEQARSKAEAFQAAARAAKDLRLEAIGIDLVGLIRQREGRPEVAAASHQRAVNLLRNAPAGLLSRLNAWNNLGVALLLSGRYIDARNELDGLLVAARGATSLPGTQLVVARAENNRGLALQELGRDDEARSAFDAAAIAAQRPGATSSEKRLAAEALNNQGRSYGIDAGSLDEARRRLARARALASDIDVRDSLLEANIVDSLAEVLLAAEGAAEDREALAREALAATDEGLALEARSSSPGVRAGLLVSRARALLRLGRAAESLATLSDAERIAASTTLPGIKRDVLMSRAELHRAAGRLDDAIADYARAIALLAASQTRRLAERERDRVRTVRRLYGAMVETCLANGEIDRALEYLDASRTQALRDEMVRRTPAFRDKELERALAGYYGVFRREEALAAQVQTLKNAGASRSDAATALERELVSVHRQVVSALDEAQKKYGQSQYDRFFQGRPRSFQRLARVLPAGHLLVAFFPAEDRLWLFIASRETGFQWRQNTAVSAHELDDRIREYRSIMDDVARARGLRVDSWTDDAVRDLRDTTDWLYRALLGPIEREWQSATHLIIAPIGRLHYLPFAALGPWNAATGSLDFVALRASVSYVTEPDLLGLATEPPQPRNLRILALGNPRYGRTTPPLEPLPGAKREVEEIAAIPRASVVPLAGPQATLADLRRELAASPQPFGILHLGTHAVVEATRAGGSWLAFEETTKLAASEVGSLDRLEAMHLVTLSACRTAIAMEDPGTDVISLAAYFGAADIPSLVVSLWNVNDRATATLMTAFYKTLLGQSPVNKAKALQAASVALIGAPETRHPYYWAPFILIGDWR